MTSQIKKAIKVLQSDGIEILSGKLLNRLRTIRKRGRYQQWIKRYHSLSEADVCAIKKLVSEMVRQPVISVLMPVYDTDERYLRAAIDSVRDQIYGAWELCIADDHSRDPHIRTILAEYAAADPRIKIALRNKNGHISAASNTALALVTGEFTALMDHDDELSPLALYFVAREIVDHPKTNIIYTDEDKIDENGVRFEPFFKPDWSPEFLLGVNYVNHLTVYRSDLMRRCGAFRLGYEGSQDYDLLLRAIEHCSPSTIRHIPRILYHWRAITGSVAYASDEKPYAHDRARNAISEHFQRIGVSASVSRGIGQLHRVAFDLPDPRPKVSVIVHGERSAVGLDKILETSGVFPVEVVTTSLSGCTVRGSSTTWVSPDHQNRYAQLNMAAHAATGSVLCFLSSDVRSGSELWLETLVSYAIQEQVGAVGPMIYDTNGRIISAGFVLGAAGRVQSAFLGETLKPRGRSLRLDISQNVSAVPVDCLVISARTFAMIGGFDEGGFEACGAVDLGIRLSEAGFRNVWTPQAEVMQNLTPRSRPRSGFTRLKELWPSYFINDPYYNPNLSLDAADYSLSFPPRLEKY